MMRPSSVAEWMALKFEPPPDTNTANLFLLGLLEVSAGGCNADVQCQFTAGLQLYVSECKDRGAARGFSTPVKAKGMLDNKYLPFSAKPAFEVAYFKVVGQLEAQATLISNNNQ